MKPNNIKDCSPNSIGTQSPQYNSPNSFRPTSPEKPSRRLRPPSSFRRRSIRADSNNQQKEITGKIIYSIANFIKHPNIKTQAKKNYQQEFKSGNVNSGNNTKLKPIKTLSNVSYYEKVEQRSKSELQISIFGNTISLNRNKTINNTSCETPKFAYHGTNAKADLESRQIVNNGDVTFANDTGENIIMTERKIKKDLQKKTPKLPVVRNCPENELIKKAKPKKLKKNVLSGLLKIHSKLISNNSNYMVQQRKKSVQPKQTISHNQLRKKRLSKDSIS